MDQQPTVGELLKLAEAEPVYIRAADGKDFLLEPLSCVPSRPILLSARCRWGRISRMVTISVQQLHDETERFVRQAGEEEIQVQADGRVLAVLSRASPSGSVWELLARAGADSGTGKPTRRVGFDAGRISGSGRSVIYFDAAYILKCYSEPHCQLVRQLLVQHRGAASCLWGRLEFAAGVHRAVREGKLSAADAALVFQTMRRDEAQSLWTWLPLTPAVAQRVNVAFETLSPQVFLRTGDAVHLACAGTRLQRGLQ